MSNTVKVWNDNTYPYEEVFMGKTVKIAPKDFVEMKLPHAEKFLGTFPSPTVDGSGQQNPATYKMLRISQGNVDHKQAEARAQLICTRCSYEASSSVDLEEHIDSKHLDELEDQKLAQERKEKKQRTARKKID
jgi:hypothetical protein